MAEQHAAPAATSEAQVRVYGMGADGRPFFQAASAGNFTAEGAVVSGIDHELKVGDTIGIQYLERKVRCKILWVLNVGPLQKVQAGLQLLSDQECPWKAAIPAPGQAESKADNPQNRRRFYRHKISFPMELKDERVNTPMRVNSTDVSGNGCYIETILPLPKATTLKVDFWMEEEKISTTAVVRTSDPGVGMGIEFISLSDENRHRVQDHLDKLDPRTPGFAESKEPS
jgi:hypothetical protein